MQMPKASNKHIQSLLLNYQNQLRSIEKQLESDVLQLSEVTQGQELPYVHTHFLKMLHNIKKQKILCERIGATLL